MKLIIFSALISFAGVAHALDVPLQCGQKPPQIFDALNSRLSPQNRFFDRDAGVLHTRDLPLIRFLLPRGATETQRKDLTDHMDLLRAGGAVDEQWTLDGRPPRSIHFGQTRVVVVDPDESDPGDLAVQMVDAEGMFNSVLDGFDLPADLVERMRRVLVHDAILDHGGTAASARRALEVIGRKIPDPGYNDADQIREALEIELAKPSVPDANACGIRFGP